MHFATSVYTAARILQGVCFRETVAQNIGPDAVYVTTFIYLQCVVFQGDGGTEHRSRRRLRHDVYLPAVRRHDDVVLHTPTKSKHSHWYSQLRCILNQTRSSIAK